MSSETLTLPVLTAIFALLAAAIHVYIFILESVRWRQPSAWRRFGIKDQTEANTMASMAYNQGFYNLFLAIGAGVGAVLGLANHGAGAGFALGLVVLACGSMVAAALVLITSDRKFALAATVQGLAPLIALFGLLFLL